MMAANFYPPHLSPFGEPRAGTHTVNSDRNESVNALRLQVNEVKLQMRENLNKLLERGESIDVLANRSDKLDASSTEFRTLAYRVHRRSCLHYWKWRLILAGLVLLLICAMIVLTMYKNGTIDQAPPILATQHTMKATSH